MYVRRSGNDGSGSYSYSSGGGGGGGGGGGDLLGGLFGGIGGQLINGLGAMASGALLSLPATLMGRGRRQRQRRNVERAYNQAIGNLNQSRNEAMREASTQAGEARGNVSQSMISRGLYNTTALEGANAGVDRALGRTLADLASGYGQQAANLNLDKARDMNAVDNAGSPYAGYLQQLGAAVATNPPKSNDAQTPAQSQLSPGIAESASPLGPPEANLYRAALGQQTAQADPMDTAVDDGRTMMQRAFANLSQWSSRQRFGGRAPYSQRFGD